MVKLSKGILLSMFQDILGVSSTKMDITRDSGESVVLMCIIGWGYGYDSYELIYYPERSELSLHLYCDEIDGSEYTIDIHNVVITDETDLSVVIKEFRNKLCETPNGRRLLGKEYDDVI